MVKDVKKAIQLFKRAADLGNGSSQDQLAKEYYTGNPYLLKCLEKARYYAEKGVAQGLSNSQFIPAKLDDNRKDEAFQLFTLAVFQGCLNARHALGYYYRKFGCKV